MIPRTGVQAGIFGLGKFLSRMFSFFALIYVARRIGPNHMGVYIYLISLASLFLSLSGNTVAAEVQIKAKKDKATAINDSVGFIMASILLSSVAAVLVVILKGYSVFLALGVAGLVIVRSFYEFLNIVHFLKGRIRYVTLSTIGERLLFTVIVFMLPPKTLTLIGAAMASFFIFDIFLYKRSGVVPNKKLDTSYFSGILFLALIFSTIGTRVPVLVYESTLGLTALGIFGAAWTVYQTGEMIFIDGFRFVQARIVDMSEDAKRKFISGTAIIGIVMLLAVTVLRPLEIWLIDLVYGVKYPGVGIVFANLAFALPAMILSFYPRGMLLYTSRKRMTASLGIYAAAMTIGALLSKDVYQASWYFVMGYWMTAFAWWLILKIPYKNLRTETKASA